MTTRARSGNAESIHADNVLALAATDLACFCLAVNTEFELAKHTAFLITRLEAIERGQSGLGRPLSRAARLLLSTHPDMASRCCWRCLLPGTSGVTPSAA
jgi:hypothetical protein